MTKHYKGKSRGKKANFVYDFEPKHDYCMAIFNGPSILRLNSLAKLVELVRVGGIIVFEHCRQEVGVMKNLGFFLHESKNKGRHIYKRKVHKRSKPIWIPAVSWFEVTKKVKDFFNNDASFWV